MSEGWLAEAALIAAHDETNAFDAVVPPIVLLLTLMSKPSLLPSAAAPAALVPM